MAAIDRVTFDHGNGDGEHTLLAVDGRYMRLEQLLEHARAGLVFDHSLRDIYRSDPKFFEPSRPFGPIGETELRHVLKVGSGIRGWPAELCLVQRAELRHAVVEVILMVPHIRLTLPMHPDQRKAYDEMPEHCRPALYYADEVLDLTKDLSLDLTLAEYTRLPSSDRVRAYLSEQFDLDRYGQFPGCGTRPNDCEDEDEWIE